MLHEYAVLYWTMDLGYNYKRDTDIAEKHFHKTYWMLWPNTHAHVLV